MSFRRVESEKTVRIQIGFRLEMKNISRISSARKPGFLELDRQGAVIFENQIGIVTLHNFGKASGIGIKIIGEIGTPYVVVRFEIYPRSGIGGYEGPIFPVFFTFEGTCDVHVFQGLLDFHQRCEINGSLHARKILFGDVVLR